MTTTILKSELTKAIAGISDKSLLEALYTIMNRANKVEYELSEEDWRIVEDRRKAYKSGKAKTVTMSDIRKDVIRKLAR